MFGVIIKSLYKNGLIFASSFGFGNNKYLILNSLYFRYAPEIMNQNDLINTSFFAIPRHQSDIIRFHQASVDLISLISNSTWDNNKFWHAGIQLQTRIHNATEFKPNGSPWSLHDQEIDESK